jgi:hypothetical protein
MGVRRFGQGDNARGSRIEVLHEALDGAALASCVTALEQDHVLGAGFLRSVLEFEQLNLQRGLLILVLVAFHPLVVRVVDTPGLDWIATGIYEIRIRAVLVVADAVPLSRVCSRYSRKFSTIMFLLPRRSTPATIAGTQRSAGGVA